MGANVFCSTCHRNQEANHPKRCLTYLESFNAWDSLLKVAKIIYHNNILWDRALDKLLFGFSSISLDLGSIDYLKPKT